MTRNVILRIITLVLIFQIMFLPISNASHADEIINQGDSFFEEGKNHQIVVDNKGNAVGTILDTGEMQEAIDSVFGVVFTLGVALSVIIGAVLGIQFMMGSVEEQAKIKEMVIPYMLGCIVVFGAFGIWKIVIGLGLKIFN